jgi:hypothetical protein
MLYAIRNEQGKITSLSETFQEGAEAVDLSHPDVRSFLSVKEDSFSPDTYLDQSDIAIARIVEDLIELLVSRNLIIFTDLPDVAQRKLLTRKLARKLIAGEEEEDTDASQSDSSFLADDSTLI